MGMKTLKVYGKIIRSGDTFVRNVIDVEEGLEVNTPSLIMNLLTLRKKIRQSQRYGFEYVFPFSFDPILERNGFKNTFPIIFE